MRFLLISDTHGKLWIINELVAKTQADAVIHAGDFGFYDDDSYERLSERERRLHVTHSTPPPTESERILALPREELTATLKAECPSRSAPWKRRHAAFKTVSKTYAMPAWTKLDSLKSGLSRHSHPSGEFRTKKSVLAEGPRYPVGIVG